MNTIVLAPVQAPAQTSAASLASEAHRANTRAQALVTAIELAAIDLERDGLRDQAASLRARMRHALGKAVR